MTAKTYEPAEETIRTAAYYIWLAEGRPEGRQDLHWERARVELAEGGLKKARRSSSAKPAAAKRTRSSPAAAKKTATRTVAKPAAPEA